MIKIKQSLNIFIDESRDFGFTGGSSKLYGVSFTIHESENSIIKDLKYLNNRLKETNYDGMIHLTDLVARRGDYANFNLEQRKNIFWSIFYFSKRVKVKIYSIIIDKRYKNKQAQLNRELKIEMNNFFNLINDYMSEFEKVVIYYDNGQEALGRILDTLITNKNNIQMTKAELYFFSIKDIMGIIRQLKSKRLI